MILTDIALLASNTARTKAYIQMMVRENLIPSLCLVYTDDIKSIESEPLKSCDSCGYDYFDLDESLLSTIKNNNINYELINNKDINSQEFSGVLKDTDQKYLIYSGYGGYILKPHLFQLGKKYIHVHAGILPQYRGSTTVYYSMLQEGFIGATAIFLSEGIDEGEIITQGKFSIPEKDTNIDTLYEPYIRSQVLKKALKGYVTTGNWNVKKQDNHNAQTFYIIHPVLKHLALMGDCRNKCIH